MLDKCGNKISLKSVETEHPGKQALDRIQLGVIWEGDERKAIQYLGDELASLRQKLGERGKQFVPPTAEEVTAYANKIGYALDGNTFVNYYEARNWMLGKNKMKSWQASVKYWKSLRTQAEAQKHKSESDTIKFCN